MTTATDLRVVVSTTGPVMSRTCVALGDGRHVWVERPDPRGPYARVPSFAADVAAASRALRDHRSDRVAPVVAYEDGALVHAPAPASTMAVPLLTRADPAAFGDAGALLATFHRTAVDARATPVMHDDLVAATVGTSWLPPDCVLATSARDALSATTTGDVTCHGRWSVGSLLLGGDGRIVAVLAGADVWRGPREHDLGYLLGELAEVAALQGPGTGWRAGADALVAAYASAARPPDPDLLVAWTALRLVDHLLRMAWRDHASAAAHAAVLLGAVTPLLDEVHAIGSRHG